MKAGIATSIAALSALAAALLTAVVVTIAEPPTDEATQLAPLPAPEPTCIAAARAAARSRRAQAAERSASAKIARYPYAPAEGLPALALLLEASRCAALAGDPETATVLARRATAWQSRLDREYRSRFVRYRRARTAGRREEARNELAYLTELLGNEQGAFAAALRRQQLELEQSAPKEITP